MGNISFWVYNTEFSNIERLHNENTNFQKQVKGILTRVFFSFAIKRSEGPKSRLGWHRFSLLSVFPESRYPSYQCGWFLAHAYMHKVVLDILKNIKSDFVTWKERNAALHWP